MLHEITTSSIMQCTQQGGNFQSFQFGVWLVASSKYDEHIIHGGPKRWHRCTYQLPVWLITHCCARSPFQDPTSTFAGAFLSVPVMEIFWPCPSQLQTSVDFPCFRVALGSDLIWSESTALDPPAYGSIQKEFPIRSHKCTSPLF